MKPKYFILRHIITGKYQIASIIEWGGKYTLEDYILISSTDTLASAEISVKKLMNFDKIQKQLEETKSANRIIDFFRKNSLSSLDIPVFVNGTNIKDIQLESDNDNNYFFNLITD